MAKPLRSPLLGYNHNLRHLGRVFHVQSEDSGPAMPRVFTHLFYEGTILVSRKQEYDAALPDHQVRALMQTQHKTVMKDLMQARLDDRIIAFFAARGEDVAPVQGAVPAAPLLETSEPMMVLPAAVATSAAAAAVLAGAVDRAQGVVARAVDRDTEKENAPVAPAAPGPRRTTTRPIDTSRQRGMKPTTPALARPPDAHRSPFVSSGTPTAARMSSADGVVVQRSVVVGGTSVSSPRPARIRPPVPYVVTGGGHTERPPGPARNVSGSAAIAASGSAASALPASSGPTPAPLVSASSVEGHRSTGGFGVGLADDKSLDEVILEYLAEDGD